MLVPCVRNRLVLCIERLSLMLVPLLHDLMRNVGKLSAGTLRSFRVVNG